jgi:hypothetical protein
LISFDGASLLLQWATGGLLFVWLTTRRRVVSLGYGWLMRGVYCLMAIGACYTGVRIIDPMPVRDLSSAGVAIASGVALAISILRRRAGVKGQKAIAEGRSARVAAMTGIEREATEKDETASEFPPVLDLIAPAIGLVRLLAVGLAASSSVPLSLARLLVGAAFLGAVTDAMLLGHWYLVQPGMARGPLLELVWWVGGLCIPEVLLMLVPTGMISVLDGTIADGYNGLLGWFWVACAVTTIGLIVVTRLALKERAYSAVMAATGLLYLAILTAFGTDLVARALLSGH